MQNASLMGEFKGRVSMEGVNVKDNNLSIVVKDVDKDFVIVSDKANTLKEELVDINAEENYKEILRKLGW